MTHLAKFGPLAAFLNPILALSSLYVAFVLIGPAALGVLPTAVRVTITSIVRVLRESLTRTRASPGFTAESRIVPAEYDAPTTL